MSAPNVEGDIHSLPVDDLIEHEVDRRCPCGPRLFVMCDECDAGCWRCKEGWLEVTHEPVPPSIPSAVVHNALDGRD